MWLTERTLDMMRLEQYVALLLRFGAGRDIVVPK